MLNLILDSDLGRETVPETCVRFDDFMAKVDKIMTQSLAEYDHFLEQYPSSGFLVELTHLYNITNSKLKSEPEVRLHETRDRCSLSWKVV